MIELHLTGLVIKGRQGYSSLCPEVDVASQGATIGEATHMLLEAVQLYVETALESNLPVIRPVPKDEDPRQRRRAVLTQFPIRLVFDVTAHAAIADTQTSPSH